MNRPATAHANEKAAAMSPTCACVRFRSGWMNVPRNAKAWRSRNTMPKFALSSAISSHW